MKPSSVSNSRMEMSGRRKAYSLFLQETAGGPSPCGDNGPGENQGSMINVEEDRYFWEV